MFWTQWYQHGGDGGGHVDARSRDHPIIGARQVGGDHAVDQIGDQYDQVVLSAVEAARPVRSHDGEPYMERLWRLLAAAARSCHDLRFLLTKSPLGA